MLLPIAFVIMVFVSLIRQIARGTAIALGPISHGRGRCGTSTMIASAPAATAARAIGVTLSRMPIPCDGSATTGKWLLHGSPVLR